MCVYRLLDSSLGGGLAVIKGFLHAPHSDQHSLLEFRLFV